MATPEPDEAPASGGFVPVSLSPVLQEGDSQEWVMLELEQSGCGAPGATRPPDVAPSEEKRGNEKQASEQQEDQCPAVPTSPVLSQMSMPGTWLLGHRRIPGMLGQMPSVIMGRSQSDQVRLIRNQGFNYKQLVDYRNLLNNNEFSNAISREPKFHNVSGKHYQTLIILSTLIMWRVVVRVTV